MTRVPSLTYIIGWIITAGPIVRLVRQWEGRTLCMAHSTISYCYLEELQTLLRRTEHGNSGRWHCKVVNGYLLLA